MNGYFIQSSIQFIKFGVVGVSNTTISLCVYYAFISFDTSFYILGNTAGFIAGVFNSYYWNNKYVFKKTVKGHVRPLLKSFALYGATFLLSTALLIVMVEYLSISEWAAPLINLIITVPLNFLLNKFWAFR